MEIEFVIIENDSRRFRSSVRRMFKTSYDQKYEGICLSIALADALTVTFRIKYGQMVDFSPQPLLQRHILNFKDARACLLNPDLGLQEHCNYQFIHIAGLPNYQSGNHYTLKDLKLVFGWDNIVAALKWNFGPWGPKFPIVAGVDMNKFGREEARLAWSEKPFRRDGDRGKEALVFSYEEEVELASKASHVVIITGLDTSSLYEEEHVLEIKNSWGGKWGEGGYSKVTYHFIDSIVIPVFWGDVEEVDQHHHPLELNTSIGQENSMNGICFSDDGHHLATACDDGVVRIFHMGVASSISFECTDIISFKAGCHPTAVAFADDASVVVACKHAAIADNDAADDDVADDDVSVAEACKSAPRKGSSLYIYGKDNSRDGDDSPQFHLKNEIHEVHYQKHIVSLYGAKVASVDGSTLLVSSSEGTDIKILEGKSGKRLGIADTNQGKNNMATISPDGQYIVAATLGHTVKVWKIEYGLDASSAAVTKVKSLTGHKGEVTWLCFTPDSNRIISASVDGCLRVWNINVSDENASESKILKKTPIPQDLKKTTRLHYDRLAISPDGKILAVTQNSVLQWLSFETGEVLDTAESAHEGDKNVSVLATLGDDKKLKLWTAPALP
ncbi:transducin/WD40 repeat-like superfamily protein [Artemisia annua]|uniref:Transducin/WD40 repeat-like superfamily protein n=1 Tax=Artemisia annua TaxID=35608 RepID=A0A2U1QLC8_ARTAN|nr:transducin/WD40 repeat-like superfamily protein [Artemisia annua]